MILAGLLSKIRSARRIVGNSGVAGLLRYSARRYKYPFLRFAVWLNPSGARTRKPHVVQVEVSSKCNLRCPSCSLSREPLAGHNLSVAEFAAILNRLSFRPSLISLNGIGEPLVNPHFFDLLDYLVVRGIACTFFTNGTLLAERVSKEVLAHANVRFVGISCDGATKETFERLRFGADFAAWKANVQAFVGAAGRRQPNPVQVTMSTVVSTRNRDELGSIVALAADLGFPSVRFSQVFPHDEVAASMALTEEQCAALDRRGLIVLGKQRGVAVSFSPEHWKVPRGLNCFQPWEYVQISAEGDILPCCAIVGSAVAPVMGNVFVDDFAAVWHGQSFHEFRRTSARFTNPLCARCPYH
jgi:radical SAM protein with 4Fe4S-binding SPASM domain